MNGPFALWALVCNRTLDFDTGGGLDCDADRNAHGYVHVDSDRYTDAHAAHLAYMRVPPAGTKANAVPTCAPDREAIRFASPNRRGRPR